MAIADVFSSCIWFTATNTRNATAAFVSALLFFAGWWFIIDASTEHGGGVNFAHHLLGILGTISFIMINTVELTGDSYGEDGIGTRIRAWLFIGFVLGFSSIIAATWIMIADFSIIDEKASKWPGVALLLQNVFIFFSSLLYKFGRSQGDIPYGF